MKRFLLFFAAALLLTACDNKFEDEGDSIKGVNTLPTLTAEFAEEDTRTYVEDNFYLRWHEGDLISAFLGNTLNNKYIFKGETGDNSGTFSAVSSGELGSNYPLDNIFALYPYDENAEISKMSVISYSLPAVQEYAENSFGKGVNTMVAITKSTNDTFLAFKNVCGYLMVKLYGDATIKSIELKGNNGEKIAGAATITAVYGSAPAVAMADEATDSITLDCGEGVELSTDAEKPTEFWFVVPPTTFEEGLMINVTDIDGDSFTKSTSNAVLIERNIIKPMNALEIVIQGDENIPYLTFTADAAQSLTMSRVVETLEYSVGNEKWTSLGTKKVIFGGENGTLRLRGKSSIGTAEKPTLGAALYGTNVIFGDMNVPVACKGDIRTLIDWCNYSTVDTSNARFYCLFRDCKNLISAPELSISKLATYCYSNMFENCISLKTPPQLPSMELMSDCYYAMFKGCTALTVTPQLPATDLIYSCYERMFEGCTNITSAPELISENISMSCYERMFKDCINLQTPPKLPAKTLRAHCYDGMFLGCINLAVAPELPAETLATRCYHSMFEDCIKLQTPPALPAKIIEEACYNGMFRGCVNLKTAPELPGKELDSQCYWGMFEGCVSLTKAPNLPATSLDYCCYYSMFKDCTSLTTAPELPAKRLASTCYSSMFEGCTSLTVAPELPATKLADICYSHMFTGCTNLTVAPVLPAETLVDRCYQFMFNGCNNLSKITMLATNIDEYRCLYEWVEGVSSTGIFTKANEMIIIPEGSSGIPSGWTIQNYIQVSTYNR